MYSEINDNIKYFFLESKLNDTWYYCSTLCDFRSKYVSINYKIYFDKNIDESNKIVDKFIYF